LTGQAYHFSRE